MFAEIINTAITTTAWSEIKPVGTYALCEIGIQAVDDATFKISITGTDDGAYWTVKENAAFAPGDMRLTAGTRIFYAKAISADTTVQTIVRRS